MHFALLSPKRELLMRINGSNNSSGNTIQPIFNNVKKWGRSNISILKWYAWAVSVFVVNENRSSASTSCDCIQKGNMHRRVNVLEMLTINTMQSRLQSGKFYSENQWRNMWRRRTQRSLSQTVDFITLLCPTIVFSILIRLFSNLQCRLISRKHSNIRKSKQTSTRNTLSHFSLPQ